MQEEHNESNEIRWFQGISTKIKIHIDQIFFGIGFTVASSPKKTIILVILATLICCFGFFRFRIEKNPFFLWVPKDSNFLTDTKWVMDNTHYAYRPQNVLITAPNVLQSNVLQKLLVIHNEVIQTSGFLKNGTLITWKDVCMKIPFLNNIATFKMENDDEVMLIQKQFEPSVNSNSMLFCHIVNNLHWGCTAKNILDIWKYDLKLLNKSNNEYIKELLKNTTVSPVTGHKINYNELLGGSSWNIYGQVLSAKAILSQWYIYINFSNFESEKSGNLAGTEDWVTEDAAIWEEAFLNKMRVLKDQLDDNEVKIYYEAGRSFSDISSKTMLKQSKNILTGILIMFIFIQVVLSEFNWIDCRVLLSGFGLLTVFLAFLSTCGICSFLQVSYGPVHTSLPFLLMGLGVDDIFVLMACWRKTNKSKVSLEKKIALMLQNAGASITVTSLTDMIAFLVGAITVIPSLRSFCIYAAFGVFITYIYLITFYVAICALDEKRIEAKRNGLIPFIVHANNRGDKKYSRNLMQKSLNYIYSRIILTKYGKIFILLTVICMTSISTKELLKLKQKFNPNWLIPEKNYLYDYLREMEHYFPESGCEGSIFIGKINYPQNLLKINNLSEVLEERGDIIQEQTSWVKPFFSFVNIYYNIDLYNKTLNDYYWRFYLSKFLFSQTGGRFQANFKFDKILECGKPTPNVTVSSIDFRFKKFDDRNVYVPVMHYLENLVAEMNLTSSGGFATVWAKAYANWIIDEIIDQELLRNILLALVCVIFCTYIVIYNVQVCFWVLICVLITLINVCGFMHLWGLTIDLVSCIGLQLAVGLCVDYAAHIGHTFLRMSDKDLNVRALKSVLHIGSAVLYGGTSTILALSMLSGSEAYIFSSFFKIFLLVITFGLFNGIVLFPIILSLCGPKVIQIPSTTKKIKNIYDSNIENEAELSIEILKLSS